MYSGDHCVHAVHFIYLFPKNDDHYYQMYQSHLKTTRLLERDGNGYYCSYYVSTTIMHGNGDDDNNAILMYGVTMMTTTTR